MKTFNNQQHLNKILVLSLIFCLFTISGYSQKKTVKSNSFYAKITLLKPEMTKDEVKNIMGEPYKISFRYNYKQEFEETLYYKTSVYIEKWSIIIYQCRFINDKLKSLTPQESNYESTNISIENKQANHDTKNSKQNFSLHTLFISPINIFQ